MVCCLRWPRVRRPAAREGVRPEAGQPAARPTDTPGRWPRMIPRREEKPHVEASHACVWLQWRGRGEPESAPPNLSLARTLASLWRGLPHPGSRCSCRCAVAYRLQRRKSGACRVLTQRREAGWPQGRRIIINHHPPRCARLCRPSGGARGRRVTRRACWPVDHPRTKCTWLVKASRALRPAASLSRPR
jgi:hypothetical protein